MKFVIIGGGIAGLTFGALLHQRNHEVVICERFNGIPNHGHAFLMHAEGLATMYNLDYENEAVLSGELINTFNLRMHDGQTLSEMQLDDWLCIKRTDLIKYLYDIIPSEIIQHHREFSHFLYEGEKVVAAVFTNGEIEYGDYFIGADGGYSNVRNAIMGEVEFSPVHVKEIVGVCRNEDLANQYSHSFTKYQSLTSSRAFGFIPTSEDEFVWFIQFENANHGFDEKNPEELKKLTHYLLEGFSPTVFELLDSNEFSTYYVWKTRDFPLLPSFHKNNVALIGDSAHLTVPFTSAGTTNAIRDAQVLSDALDKHDDFEQACRQYYQQRHHNILEHIQRGRELRNEFLTPKDPEKLSVPLVKQDKNNGSRRDKKPVNLLYFTDPVCSTCWVLQPYMRKLELEYGHVLDTRISMGGLLPSWDGFDQNEIQKPADAASLWEKVCSMYDQPLDGDIWFEDPLPSSFPPSIAYKAAQIQSEVKAVIFLRRIKEMLFMEKKNIIKWEHIKQAAQEAGLDATKMTEEYSNQALDLFKADLMLARQFKINSFPTLIFTNRKGKSIRLSKYQPYKSLEDTIQHLFPDVSKILYDTDPYTLFQQFKTMTTKEVEVLCNVSQSEANKIISGLQKEGYIEEYSSKNGSLWISNIYSEAANQQYGQYKKDS